jgi:hypothetical protein
MRRIDDGSRIASLLLSIKSSGMLATKMVKLTTLPRLWKNKQSLRAIGFRLAERAAELERAPTGVGGGESESDFDTNSAGTTHFAASPACAHEAVHAVSADRPGMHDPLVRRSTFCRRCTSNHGFQCSPVCE